MSKVHELYLRMNAETPIDVSCSSAALTLEGLVSQANHLYTLPAVACQVIQLTRNPKVDTHALKECIQTDPALAAKILRVVNSSLFGLSQEVRDLNQAIALLGTKPLKLLVLGFSLPEKLFYDVAREQLDWFWMSTLTRAVAARTISEKLYYQPGDDAFLAGLLQDIGVLVLLGQLQEPYANFLSSVINDHADLEQFEIESLGFDHRALTVALLRHWQMPEFLVESIAQPRHAAVLARQNLPVSDLSCTLHIADLLAELVGRNRLDVLPDLLELGVLYGKFDRDKLTEIVSYLQPQVNQLAEAMSLQLPKHQDFVAIMTDAHQQISLLAENVSAPLSLLGAGDGKSDSRVLVDAAHLRSAVDSFLGKPLPKVESKPQSTDTALSGTSDLHNTSPLFGQLLAEPVSSQESAFERILTLTVGQCRAQRKPVSLVILGAVERCANENENHQVISQVLDAVCQETDVEDLVVESRGPCHRVLLLADFDRQQAVRFGQQTLERIQGMIRHLEVKGKTISYLVGAGVASVTLPPKNFPPLDLLETAQRCLSAAHAGGVFAVKSLEIY
ncbi:MAG: hypothetical protein CMJ72_02020 [Planctomycetaceae bacterium]|nr:hypothetical protein [Planctomycetaceae bacterium]